MRHRNQHVEGTGAAIATLTLPKGSGVKPTIAGAAHRVASTVNGGKHSRAGGASATNL
jgi:hypothetical protein